MPEKVKQSSTRSRSEINTPKFSILNNLDHLKPIAFNPDYIKYKEHNTTLLEQVELTQNDFLFLTSINCLDELEFLNSIKSLEDKAHNERKVVFRGLKNSDNSRIFDYWKEERERNKRSFLRKYWRKNDLQDKFLAVTFPKIEEESSFNLLKKKRHSTNEYETYQNFKLIRMELQIAQNILESVHLKESKKREIVSIDETHFLKIKEILLERILRKEQLRKAEEENRLLEAKRLEEKKAFQLKIKPFEKIDESVEHLETTCSIDEEDKILAENKLKKLKKTTSKQKSPQKADKQIKERTIIKIPKLINDATIINETIDSKTNQPKETFSNSISSKYISEIVKKKLTSGTESAPPKKFNFKALQKQKEIEKSKQLSRKDNKVETCHNDMKDPSHINDREKKQNADKSYDSMFNQKDKCFEFIQKQLSGRGTVHKKDNLVFFLGKQHSSSSIDDDKTNIEDMKEIRKKVLRLLVI